MTDSQFPRRSASHISEDTSIRVFQDCLPPQWIFRDQGTRNDYGVDAEVELVGSDGSLRGYIAKVQLKGRESIDFGPDGKATVGGIKQSTLRYWLGLSRYANVLVAATDNAAREAYFNAVFWQATQLVDGTDASRSIRFERASSLRTTAGRTLFALAVLERPWSAIWAHENLVRAFPRTVHDFSWVFQADPWMTHSRPQTVKAWLRLGRQLLGTSLREEDEHLFDFSEWCAESDRTWGDSPMYGTLQKAYLATFGLVIPEMARTSARIIEASHYWSSEAPEYFAEVERLVLPSRYDYDGIMSYIEENRELLGPEE